MKNCRRRSRFSTCRTNRIPINIRASWRWPTTFTRIPGLVGLCRFSSPVGMLKRSTPRSISGIPARKAFSWIAWPASAPAGVEYWFYNGGRPAAGAITIDAPATDARATIWAAFKHDVRVYFYWHSVHWRHNSQKQGERNQNVWAESITFDNRKQPQRSADDQGFINGDGVLMYPGQDRLHTDQDRGVVGPIGDGATGELPARPAGPPILDARREAGPRSLSSTKCWRPSSRACSRMRPNASAFRRRAIPMRRRGSSSRAPSKRRASSNRVLVSDAWPRSKVFACQRPTGERRDRRE